MSKNHQSSVLLSLLLNGIDLKELQKIEVAEKFLSKNAPMADIPYELENESYPLTLAQRAVSSMDYELTKAILKYTLKMPSSISLASLVVHPYRKVECEKYYIYKNNVQKFVQLFMKYDRDMLSHALYLANSIQNVVVRNLLQQYTDTTEIYTNDGNKISNKMSESEVADKMFNAIQDDNLKAVKDLIDTHPNAISTPIRRLGDNAIKPIVLAYSNMRGTIVKYLANLYEDPSEYFQELPEIWEILKFPVYIDTNVKNTKHRHEMLYRFSKNIDTILELMVYKVPYGKIECDKKDILTGLYALIRSDSYSGVKAYIRYFLPLPTISDLMVVEACCNLSYNLVKCFVQYSNDRDVCLTYSMRDMCKALLNERESNIIKRNLADIESVANSGETAYVTIPKQSILPAGKVENNNLSGSEVQIHYGLTNANVQIVSLKIMDKIILKAINENNILYLNKIIAEYPDVLKTPIHSGPTKAPAIYWAYNAMRGEMVKNLTSLYSSPMEYIQELPKIECILRFLIYVDAMTRSVERKGEMYRRFEDNIDIIFECVVSKMSYDAILAEADNILSGLWMLVKYDSVAGVKAYIGYGLPLPNISYAIVQRIEYKNFSSVLIENFIRYASLLEEVQSTEMETLCKILLEQRLQYIPREKTLKDTVDVNNNNLGSQQSITRDSFVQQFPQQNDVNILPPVVEKRPLKKIARKTTDIDSIEMLNICKSSQWKNLHEKISSTAVDPITLIHVLRFIMGSKPDSNCKNDFPMLDCIIDICYSLKEEKPTEKFRLIDISEKMLHKLTKSYAIKSLESVVSVKYVFTRETIPELCKTSIMSSGKVFSFLVQNVKDGLSKALCDQYMMSFLCSSALAGKVKIVQFILDTQEFSINDKIVHILFNDLYAKIDTLHRKQDIGLKINLNMLSDLGTIALILEEKVTAIEDSLKRKYIDQNNEDANKRQRIEDVQEEEIDFQDLFDIDDVNENVEVQLQIGIQPNTDVQPGIQIAVETNDNNLHMQSIDSGSTDQMSHENEGLDAFDITGDFLDVLCDYDNYSDL